MCNGIGDVLKKFLSARASLLQKLDYIDALLQNSLLGFELLYLLLHLFQARPLGFEAVNLIVGRVEILLLGCVGDEQEDERHDNRRDEHADAKGGFDRNRLFCSPWAGLTE
jgi:hypothetical protein